MRAAVATVSKGSSVKGKKAKRTTKVVPGTGKLQGRFCVVVNLAEGDKKPKSAVKGTKLAPVQFRGCPTSKAEAVASAQKFATIATLPAGKGKRSKKRSKKSRR